MATPPPSAGKESADKKQAARQFAIEAARLAANTRSQQVVVLDVSNLSPVCDYYVIATGTSPRQMKSVADEVSEYGKEHGFVALSASGLDGAQWMLVDFVDVVFHVFTQEARLFYDLESLWGDAKRVEWQE